MNSSDMTRREQVLAMLESRNEEWIDGTELATERVGGSEGLKRLRELRQIGLDNGTYDIERRRHPDIERDIWQYRLVHTAPVKRWKCMACGEKAVIPPTPMIDITWGEGKCVICGKRSTFRLITR